MRQHDAPRRVKTGGSAGGAHPLAVTIHGHKHALIFEASSGMV